MSKPIQFNATVQRRREHAAFIANGRAMVRYPSPFAWQVALAAAAVFAFVLVLL